MGQTQDVRTEKLKALILDLEGKTLAAQLRALMPAIDQRVRAGVRHEEILALLAQQGIAIQRDTFRKYLYRYRKSVAEGKQQPTRITSVSQSGLTPSTAIDQPAAAPAPTIRHRGDLAKLRDVDFDLDELADIGKNKERKP